MESEWIDGMKVFLHVHGINLYRIYTLSPKQLVAEILHQVESRKPYKLWDKLHINWFAAFVFRWKSPMSASGCISNIHPALEGLGLKGRPKIWPMNSGVFLIDSHEVVNNQQISGPTWLPDYLIIPNSSYCKLQDVFFDHFSTRKPQKVPLTPWIRYLHCFVTSTLYKLKPNKRNLVGKMHSTWWIWPCQGYSELLQSGSKRKWFVSKSLTYHRISSWKVGGVVFLLLVYKDHLQ